MQTMYQLFGRRVDRPQAVLFRDRHGRYFLRASCGARLVRLTNRDATALIRHLAYHRVLDGSWWTQEVAIGLGCPLPSPIEDISASTTP